MNKFYKLKRNISFKSLPIQLADIFIEFINRLDFKIIIPLIILCGLGLMNIYSIYYKEISQIPRLFQSQLIFIFIGIGFLFFFSFFNFKFINSRRIIFGIVGINIILLLLVLIIGTYSFEARRWLNLGGFSIQPSELSKLILVLSTAFLLSLQNKVKKKQLISNSYFNLIKIFFKNNIYLISSLLIAITFITLTALQKSLGNTLILLAIYTATVIPFFKFPIKLLFQIFMGVIYFIISFLLFETNENIEIKIILAVLVSFLIYFILSRVFYKDNFLLVLILSIFLFSQPFLQFTYNNILTPYQRDRVETFLSPDAADAQKEAYNVIQASKAISRGGLLGKGFMNNEFSKSGLPLPDTDFAVSSVIEQVGIIGLGLILILYYLILNQLISKADSINDIFGKYIYIGVAMMIAFNTIQHVGMNIRILPVTGVPLPFISYGGSSLLTLFLAIAIIHSVKNSEEIVNVSDLKDKYIRKINSKSRN